VCITVYYAVFRFFGIAKKMNGFLPVVLDLIVSLNATNINSRYLIPAVIPASIHSMP
jgi:hypothetical protein